MSAVRAEARKLATLALPVIGAQVGSMLMGTVDTVMVGRVSVDALAAAAIANAWIFASLLLGQGIVHGIDPVVTQAHGAGRGARAGLALQRGIVLALASSLPLGLMWLYTEPLLTLAGQDPALARAAHEYTLVQIPSIPFFLVFTALRQYLQGREIMRPAMWVVLFCNLFNAFANWLLIFGKLGFPELGLTGSGIATALTRAVMLVGLFAWVRHFDLHRDAWKPWSRAALSGPALRRLLALGIPVAIQMSLEIWAFSAATLIAGRLGPVHVAAHTIALNMAALAFMIPLGISHGAVTRVGNLLGARAPADAQRAAWVAIAMGAAVMTLSAAAFVLLRNQLPAIYTANIEVIAMCATVLPIAGVFQVFDGAQVVGCGVLRGMGRPRPAAYLNLLGYWVFALPIGGWLALETDWGLRGLWWGLCLGLALVATSLLAWIRLHGPNRDALLID
jgi:MATE family multidrug resistance protein